MINNILGFEGVWANPFPIANPPKRHKLIIDFSILYYFQFIGLTDSTHYFPFFRSFESVTTFTVRYFRYTRSDRVIFQGNLIQSFHNFLVSCAGIFLFVRICFIINQEILFQCQYLLVIYSVTIFNASTTLSGVDLNSFNLSKNPSTKALDCFVIHFFINIILS